MSKMSSSHGNRTHPWATVPYPSSDLHNYPCKVRIPRWIQHHEPADVNNFGKVIGKIVNDEKMFAVEVDTMHFDPEELSVHVTGHELLIEGNHDEKTDKHGTVKRSFTRRYTLPDDVFVDGVETSINEKGILSVRAPKRSTIGAARKIPIKVAPHV
ncbi:hypothetical protein AB6A40_000193 [Gnathostoma spinigerum]|uniref:SHSP domain-containing protein n=1 Tax=Gnathostoma spinigerum TaxID=75299 RepID=A0ABD6E1J9_9BILA